MRRNEKEIKDSKIIQEVLLKSNICRIALFDDEFPYIVPMNYAYFNNSLYFHCSKEGKKINLIRKNSNVGFEIEQSHEIIKDEVSCKWTTKYRSIIGFGKIIIINDFDEKVIGLDILMKHHGKQENVYNENAVNNVVVLKLNIEGLTGKQSREY